MRAPQRESLERSLAKLLEESRLALLKRRSLYITSARCFPSPNLPFVTLLSKLRCFAAFGVCVAMASALVQSTTRTWYSSVGTLEEGGGSAAESTVLLC